MTRRCLPILFIACLLPGGALAERYPAKPVRIVTGSPGTFHDIVTRQLADRLGKRWNQAVVVENQGAAGMTIGTGMVARAAPDGYSLVMSDRSALAVAPALQRGLSYDPVKDLVPVALVAFAPTMVVVHPAFPAADFKSFIAHVKQNPGKVAFASAGPATATHVAAAQLGQLAGLDFLLVHYKGGGAAIAAMLTGEAPVGSPLIPAVVAQVKAGRLRALAVASPKRFAGMPDVPTAAEAGLPGFESRFWIGLLAPAATPATVVAQLNADIGNILGTPDFGGTLLNQGAEPAAGTPAEFAKFIAAEGDSMRKLVQATGMRAD